MRAVVLAIALVGGSLVAACSDADEAAPAPPSVEERKAVSEAEAMIPAAEREAPPATATTEEGAPTARQPKASYQTPVPGPSPAQ